MKNPVLFFALSLLVYACNSGQPDSGADKSRSSSESLSVSLVVSPAEFKRAMTNAGAQLVDVRSMEELADGFIEGAMNIDFYSDDFQTDILKLDKEKPVLVYCRSGGRSASAAKILKEAGFKEIYDLEGGYTAWPK